MATAIADEMLKDALVHVNKLELALLPNDDKIDHVFSKKFENTMKRLIKKQRRPNYSSANLLRKKVVIGFVAAIIFSMTMAMSVSGFREGFFEMVQQIFDKFSIITYEANGEILEDSKPFVEYELTTVPEGYVLADETIDEFLQIKVATYRDKDDKYIGFDQYSVKRADFTINTEGTTLENVIVDGQEVNYYSNIGIQNVFWDNGEYVFFISGEIDKKTLLELVKYTKVKEK